MTPMKKDVAQRMLLAGLSDESVGECLRLAAMAGDRELAQACADELIARIRRNPERYPLPGAEEPTR